jgi:CBS domain-containing protein
MTHARIRYAQPASAYMRRPVRTVAHDTDLPTVFAMLNRFRISGVAVSEKSESGSPVLGVVTRTDLLSLTEPPHAGDRRTAADIMTKDVIAMPAGTPISDVARTMVTERIHRVFITEDDRLVGVITPHELIRAIVDVRHPTPIERYVSRPVLAVLQDISLREAREYLDKEGVTGLVVVRDEWPIGVFTQREALAYRRLPSDLPLEGLYSPGLVCLPHSTPLHRAATQALAANVKRVLAMNGCEVDGIVSGMDLARAVADD